MPAAEVRDGDLCPRLRPRCSRSTAASRSATSSSSGKKFADALSLDVLGPEGKPVRVTMGSYGIGVSRAVAAIAEQSHDESGLIWPALDRARRRARRHRRRGRAEGGRRRHSPRARGGRSAGPARRPAQGQPRGRVQGRRADRHPDVRGRGQEPRGGGDRRDPRPPLPAVSPHRRCGRRRGARSSPRSAVDRGGAVRLGRHALDARTTSTCSACGAPRPRCSQPDDPRRWRSGCSTPSTRGGTSGSAQVTAPAAGRPRRSSAPSPARPTCRWSRGPRGLPRRVGAGRSGTTPRPSACCKALQGPRDARPGCCPTRTGRATCTSAGSRRPVCSSTSTCASTPPTSRT